MTPDILRSSVPGLLKRLGVQGQQELDFRKELRRSVALTNEARQ